MPRGLQWSAASTLAVAGVALAQTTAPETPVEHVISLLDDMKTKVETEGSTEAASYDKFACFCKTTTSTKSANIITLRDTIKTKSSTIELKTATKEEKEEELAQLQKDHEQYVKDQEELRAVHAKEKAVFEAKQADLANAIRSLTNAMTSMENSKSFLAVRETVQRSIALAEVMHLIAEPKRQALNAFLQTDEKVDPNDAVYKYHSQGIIDTLNDLHIDFSGQKTTLETEWGKAVTTFNNADSALTGKINVAAGEIATLKDVTIPTLASEIATARSDLVNSEAELKDDQVYMKDLTSMCEARAKDWDQRSALRAKEITAITQALTVLRSDVKGRDALVNQRALLQQRMPAQMVQISAHGVVPSLLQESLKASTGVAAQAKAQSAVLALLQKEGMRLHSTLLTGAAAQIQGNPFAQVKGLIQKLIERLIAESAAEATKKGYCDEELGKARKDRDFRLEETQTLNQELSELELKEDELEAEIAELEGDLVQLRSDLNVTEQQRDIDRAANHNTIKEAREGLKAVQNAILILKVFYKDAAKATVFSQISPVDEDLAAQSSGAGFNGAYNGQQTGAKAIFGLLEVIESDFDRTVRVTTQEEAEAQAAFILYDRNARSDISAKDEKRELDEEDLTTTRNNIAKKMSDLQTAQNLLDAALEELEALVPTCVDTGMSFDERTAKRQEELTALGQALCILDTDGVEARCQGGPPGGGQTLVR